MKTLFIFLLLVSIASGSSIFFLTHPLRVAPLPDITKAKNPSPTPTPFSIEKPPSQAISGKVLTLSGETAWQSRSATEPATVRTLSQIQQGESIETGKDGEISLDIARLHLALSSQSSLEFLQLLPTSVVLLQKEGMITYENNQLSSTTIRSLHTLIKPAPATKMSVWVNAEKKTLQLTVTTGTASIAFNNSDTISTVLSVTSGEGLLYDDTTRTTRKVKQ